MQVKYDGRLHSLVRNIDGTISNSIPYCTHKHKVPHTKEDVMSIIHCEKCIEDLCAKIGSDTFNIGGPNKSRKVEVSQESGKEEIDPMITEQEVSTDTNIKDALYIFQRLLNDTVTTEADAAVYNFKILYTFYVTNISLLSDESISEELNNLVKENVHKLTEHEKLGVLSLNSHPPDPVRFSTLHSFDKSLSEIHADFFLTFLFSMRDRFAPTSKKKLLEDNFEQAEVDKLGSYPDMTKWPIIESFPVETFDMTFDKESGEYTAVTKPNFFDWVGNTYMLYLMRFFILCPDIDPSAKFERYDGTGFVIWARKHAEIFKYDRHGNAELTAFDEGDAVEETLTELFLVYRYKFENHPELMFLQMSGYKAEGYDFHPGTLMKLLITSFLHLTPEARDDIFVFGSKEIDKLPRTLEKINKTFPRSERRALYIRFSRYILLREIKELFYKFAKLFKLKKRGDIFLPPERWRHTFHSSSKMFTRQYEDAIEFTVNVQKKVSGQEGRVARYIKPTSEIERIVFREEFYALFTLYNKELASLLVILIHYTEDPLRFFPSLMPELDMGVNRN